MASIGAAARLQLSCLSCGKRVNRDAATVLKEGLPARYCCTECVIDHAPECVCLGCGGLFDPTRAGPYDRLLQGMRLPVCGECQEVAFRSCWRKRRYPNEAAAQRWIVIYKAAARMDPNRQLPGELRPYPCQLCPGWHNMSWRGGNVEVVGEFAQTLELLGQTFADIGFDIDETRGYAHNPDGTCEIVEDDRHADVHAAQRVLEVARLKAERC